MLRYFVCGLAALSLNGCVDCDDQRVYECVASYDGYYGYHNDCYFVRTFCHDHRHCSYGNCNQGQPVCSRDGDCAAGQTCSAQGYCVSPGAGGGASGGAPGADASTTDGARGGSGGASGSAGAPTGSGAHSGASGATSADGGATSGGGGRGGSGATGGGGTNQTGGTAGAGAPGGAANGGTGTASAGGSAGASQAGRIPRLNFSCVRDTQCGAGECSSGICYVACESDADCGTGDRCSVESGRRICMPDPNPAVRCDESAICTSVQTCVNGTCHDPCSTDTDCKNLQDRCTNQLCFPDRRPIAECVLNVECAADLVCLNGRCVKFGGD